MNKTITTLALILMSAAISSASHVFVSPISATSTTSGDLWPVSNLVQGPGVGFDAAAPHGRILGGSAGNWVTGAPGGFPSDFIAVAGAPVLVFDLGSDSAISAIHTWGYSVTNANGVMDFSLRFATDADGLGGFGTSIAANPLFSMLIDDIPMQTNGLGGVITTRYVEMTALTTHITNGGSGPPAGGDRVGLGEVSFSIPEPSISLLGLLAFGGLALRRRRI